MYIYFVEYNKYIRILPFSLLLMPLYTQMSNVTQTKCQNVFFTKERDLYLLRARFFPYIVIYSSNSFFNEHVQNSARVT